MAQLGCIHLPGVIGHWEFSGNVVWFRDQPLRTGHIKFSLKFQASQGSPIVYQSQQGAWKGLCREHGWRSSLWGCPRGFTVVTQHGPLCIGRLGGSKEETPQWEPLSKHLLCLKNIWCSRKCHSAGMVNVHLTDEKTEAQRDWRRNNSLEGGETQAGIRERGGGEGIPGRGHSKAKPRWQDSPCIGWVPSGETEGSLGQGKNSDRTVRREVQDCF